MDDGDFINPITDSDNIPYDDSTILELCLCPNHAQMLYILNIYDLSYHTFQADVKQFHDILYIYDVVMLFLQLLDL